MIDALTDPTGIVAAIVVVLGLGATVVGLIRPTLYRRRAAAASAARLVVSHVDVQEPPPHSEAATVSCNVQNARGRGRGAEPSGVRGGQGPAWYDLRLLVGWYDVTSPATSNEEALTLDRLHFIPDHTGMI